MDVKKFFSLYPNAKPLLKVGNRYFFNSRRDLAETESRITGHAIEEVSAPKKAKDKTGENNGTE